jgi:hypothetical protein
VIAIKEGLRTYGMVAVVALCAGFLGAASYEWVIGMPGTVRANRFEVVSPGGRLLSFWGKDDDPSIPASTPKGTLLVFMNAKGQRGAEFGSVTGNNGPTMNFYDRNHRQRVRLALTQGDDPFLGFSSNERDGSVFLGSLHDDLWTDKPGDSWGLELRSGNVRATLTAVEWFDGTNRAGVTVQDERGVSAFPTQKNR